MRALDLGNYRKARVWIGDVPDTSYPTVNVVKLSMHAGKNMQHRMTLAAVEVLVPLGGRSMYGLLGGEFRPGSIDRLDVDICVSSTTERLFPDSLATHDEVRIGLPNEYVAGVADGFALAKGELSQLISGRLLINHAAHGAVGSCETLFKHLSVILIKLFNCEGQLSSDAELVGLFPSTFS